MNTYVTLACLLAVAGYSNAGGIGLGGLGYSSVGGYGLGGLSWGTPLIKPVISAPILPAISTANVVKAAPITVLRTVPTVISTGIVKPITPIGVRLGDIGLNKISGIGLGGIGYGGLGYGGLGYGGLGYGGLGYSGLGYGGIGLGGIGLSGLGIKSLAPVSLGGLGASKLLG